MTDVVALAPTWIFGDAIGVIESKLSGDPYYSDTSVFKSHIVHLIVLFVASGLLLAIFRYLWRRISFDTSRFIEYDLRDTFFSHLLKMSPRFYDEAKIGDLISRASYDIEMIRMFLSMGLVIVVDVIAIELTALPILFYLNYKLTLFILIPLPFISFFATKFIKRISRDSRAVQDHAAVLSAEVQETYSGARVIKSFHKADVATRKFENLSDENVRINIKLSKSRGYFMALVMSAAILTQLIFLLVGGSEVIGGSFPLKDFVKVNFYLMWVVMPMAYLGWGINLYQRGLVSMERLQEILDTKPEIFDDTLADPSIKEIKGDIEFRNLTFGYGEEPVLHDVSLKIPQGKTVALVGRTGSGKSTIVSLLPRLYNPPKGSLFIDGRDIYDIPLETLRGGIGFVTQEPLLFSETIAENIAFGTESAARAKIIEAAMMSGLHKEIDEFPAKYDTMLGERGVNISGGQKQRATIARAIAIDPPILILDDALSSVDTNTEEEILANLRKVRRGRTCLIISHRVSSVKDADFIVVLNRGRIAEIGTHEELIEKRGYYYDLNRRQELKQELELDNGV